MRRAQLEAQAERIARGIAPVAPVAVAAPAPPAGAPPAPPPPPGVLGVGAGGHGGAAAVAPAVPGTYVWVAIEAILTGGRRKGEIICTEPTPLPAGHMRVA